MADKRLDDQVNHKQDDLEPATSQPVDANPTKTKSKRWLLFLGTGTFIIVLVGGFIKFSQSKPSNDYGQNPAVTDALASCQGNQFFSRSPVSPDHIKNLAPLGNLNPAGGHVTPSDHIEVILTQAVSPANNGQSPTLATPLIAPANLNVISVKYDSTNNQGQANQDYSLVFVTCRQARFYFNHVPKLAAGLMAQLTTKNQLNCNSQQETGSFTNKSCSYDVDYQAAAGDVLGSVGGPAEAAAAFDFGGFDERITPLAYLNQAKLSGLPAEEIPYTVCPIDYYSQTLKSQLYSLLGQPGQPRTIEPRCGSVMQDQAGSLQGNWYKQGTDFNSWPTSLAIVHDNYNPAVGVVSVGGTITQAGLQHFVPASGGSINREPSQTTVGQLYCYHSTQISSPVAQPSQPGQPNQPINPGSQDIRGQTLLKLTDARDLQAEYQPGDCSGSLNFSHPVSYSR